MEDTDDRKDLPGEEALYAPRSAKYLIAMALFAAILFGAISLMSIWL